MNSQYGKGFIELYHLHKKPEEINASYSKSLDIFTLYYYAGKWTPDDEQSIKVAMQEAERAAAIHWLVRGTACCVSYCYTT